MSTLLTPAHAGNTPADLFRPDGWSRSIRIGTVVPHADVGPEAEFQAMATDDITIHASRLFFSAMRAGGEMDEKIPHDPVASLTANAQWASARTSQQAPTIIC